MKKNTHWPAVILIEGLCSLNPAHAVSVNASYTYDALKRLTAVQYSNGKSLSYSYDAAGNITQIATVGVVSPTPTPTPTVLPPPSTWSTLPDNDVDGIPSEVEKAVVGPTGEIGDGNGDGIADNEQATVASIPLTNKNAQVDFVTLTLETNASTPTAQLKQVEQRALPANFPTNIAMPFGLIAFSAENIPVGGLVNFPIYVNGTVPVNGYFKQNAAGTWVNIATAIQTVGTKTRIDFAIRDGGEFDADGIANGTIVDPGGPGFKTEISVCSRVQKPIPDFAMKVDPALLEGGVELLLQQVKNVFTAISPSFVLTLRETDKLTIAYENKVYPILSIKLAKASASELEGVSFTQDGQIKIITQDHRVVYFAASVEDMQLLQQSLGDFNLTVTHLNHADGHLVVAAPDSSGQTSTVLPCISVRPDILTEPAKLMSTPGLYLQPYLENEVANITVAYHVFTDDRGELRQQAMLPTPADWASLRKVLETEGFTAVALQADGIITATDAKGITHKAIMSYQVTPSNLSAEQVSFDLSVGDVNEDGQQDLNVTYPSGDQQALILFIAP